MKMKENNSNKKNSNVDTPTMRFTRTKQTARKSTSGSSPRFTNQDQQENYLYASKFFARTKQTARKSTSGSSPRFTSKN